VIRLGGKCRILVPALEQKNNRTRQTPTIFGHLLPSADATHPQLVFLQLWVQVGGL
jgi:hypothetical protein